MKNETHNNTDHKVDEELDKMIIDEKKWFNLACEGKLKYIHDIKIPNGMNCIHENKVNKISEYSLLHDIINPSKRIKNINSHYSHILPGYMNTQKVIAEFNI